MSISKAENDNLFKELGLSGRDKKNIEKDDASKVKDFMRLFVEQLKNQNPLDPQDGAEFTAQLAQFTQVETLQNINKGISGVSDSLDSGKLLSASNMIGKSIDVPTNKMRLEGKKDIEATINIPEEPNINMLRVRVRDDVGRLVSEDNINKENLNLALSEGKVSFAWNGTGEGGNRLKYEDGTEIKDGNYKLSAEVLVGDAWRSVGTVIATKVDSVTVDKDTKEVILNASTVGTVKLSELEKISK